MKDEILFIFKLIRAVVLNESLPKEPDGVNWEHVYKLCAAQNIANLIAYANMTGAYAIPSQVNDEFSKKMYERFAVSENQNAEISKIFKLFDENNIDYMPLKGVLLQDLYPSRDMRFMADADILIRCEDKDKFEAVLLGLGFEFRLESNHEFVYNKKPFVSVELHKLLIPSYNEDMYAYYGDGWKRARLCDGKENRYELSKEDNFIYIFAHFAKHYRDAGVGVKPLIDIWLYLKKYSDMDMSYINNQLKELNLDRFYDNTKNLIDCLFEGRELDELTSQMLAFILNSGTFGSAENQTAVKTIREYMDKDISKAEKFKYIRLIFPSLKNMKLAFPVLSKLPVLLPFFWIYRIVRLLFFRRESIKIHKQRAESINSENINRMSEHIDSVGLDIYNGRKS